MNDTVTILCETAVMPDDSRFKMVRKLGTSHILPKFRHVFLEACYLADLVEPCEAAIVHFEGKRRHYEATSKNCPDEFNDAHNRAQADCETWWRILKKVRKRSHGARSIQTTKR